VVLRPQPSRDVPLASARQIHLVQIHVRSGVSVCQQLTIIPLAKQGLALVVMGMLMI
jgi:hypothetical protein